MTINRNVIFLILSFAIGPFAIADEQDTALHVTAHFGGVYALTDISAVTCNKLTQNKHRDACTITGMIIGNAANAGYKAHQDFPNDTKRALISGALGSAAAGLMLRINF